MDPFHQFLNNIFETGDLSRDEIVHTTLLCSLKMAVVFSQVKSIEICSDDSSYDDFKSLTKTQVQRRVSEWFRQTFPKMLGPKTFINPNDLTTFGDYGIEDYIDMLVDLCSCLIAVRQIYTNDKQAQMNKICWEYRVRWGRVFHIFITNIFTAEYYNWYS